MNPDKRDELYNNLINSGKVSEAEIGSLDDFKAAIADEASARQFHKNLMGSGKFGADEIGSEDDFYGSISSDFGGGESVQSASPSPQRNIEKRAPRDTYQQATNGMPVYEPGASVQTTVRKPEEVKTASSVPARKKRQEVKPAVNGSEQAEPSITEKMDKVRRNVNPQAYFDVYGRTGVRAPFATAEATAEYDNQRPEMQLQRRLTGYGKDFSTSAESAWNTAMENTAQEQGENIKMISRAGGFMPGGSGMGQLALINKAARLRNTDMEVMTSNAWEALGKEKQDAIVNDYYQQLIREQGKNAGEGAGESTMSQEDAKRILREQAEQMAKARQWQAMYDKAVEMNAPKDVRDFMFRKIVEGNTISKLVTGAARVMAGTRGDLEARDVAMQNYEKDGHKVAGIAGSVLAIATDPVTYVSGGAGGAVTKAVAEGVGKAAVSQGIKQGTRTLAGRVAESTLPRVAGGATNFALFEGLSNAVEQARMGGVYDPETGEYTYDMGEIGKAAGHGVLLGAASGVAGGLIGNVGEKIYKNIKSTAGKVGERIGEAVVSDAAMGTIFAAPELISGEGDFDTWLDNVEMMVGFRLSHGAKAIPQRFEQLRRNPESRAGFETRLRKMLDSRPDLALNKDEAKELNDAGYKDLKELVEAYKSTDGKLVVRGEELPYNRFEELMNDDRVSKAAKAKMYYYVTGKLLPEPTVLSVNLDPILDADGKPQGYVVESKNEKGEVVTRRNYRSENEANVEFERLGRQAELNSIEMLELLYDKMSSDGTTSKMLRDVIGKEYKVDIDKAIGKEPNRRSDSEKKAIEEYTKTMLKDGYEAWERSQRDAAKKQIEVPYKRGYEADEQGRRDITIEAANGDKEAEEAMSGVKQRIEDDADAMVERERDAFSLQRNDEDGSLHPATMTVDGEEREVYIKSGNVVLDSSGAIDVANSGGTIVVYDPVQGKNVMVSPQDLGGVGEVVTAEQYEAGMQAQREAYVQQQQDAATGRFNPQPGQQIEIPEAGMATVLATDGESVTLQMPDGTQQSMAIADIQSIVDAMSMEDYRQRHPEPAAPAADEGQPGGLREGVPEAFEPDMDVLINEDGQDKVLRYIGRARLVDAKGKVYEPDEEGSFLAFYDPTAVDQARYVNTKYKEEYDAFLQKVVGYKPAEQEEAEQPAEPAVQVEQPEEAPVEEQQGESVQQEVEQPAEAPEVDIYNNVKGEYPEAYREKVENTVKIKAKRVDETKKALDKANDALTATEYGSKEEAAAKGKRDKAQQAYDAAVADNELWKAIKSLKDSETLAEQEAKDAAEREERERRRAETEAARQREREAYEAEMARRRAEQERQKEEAEAQMQYMANMREEQEQTKSDFPIENDEEAMREMNDLSPRTLEEVVAWMLADTKSNYKIDPSEIREQTGYGKADLRKLPFVFAKRENGGMSPEKFGEKVEQIARENDVVFNEDDTNAGFNALLNVLGEVGSLGDLKNYIKNKRKQSAEQLHSQNVAMAASVQAEDKWVQQNSGMTAKQSNEYMNSMAQAVESGVTMLTDEENDALFSNDVTDPFSENVETKPNSNDTRTETNDEGGVQRGATESSTNEPEAEQTATAADDTRRDGGVDAEQSAAEQPAGAVAAQIEAARAAVDTHPTEGQKKAGNYPMGHLVLDGYDITLENPKGSVRSGVDADGKAWSQEMHNDYGYIRGTEGVDGDHIDVFLSDDPTQGSVFVVDQVNADGNFDEHKVMYGFPDAEGARQAYLSNYEEGWQGLGTITEVSKDEFKKWIDSSHRKTKPFAEYKNVKVEGAQNERQPSTADYRQQAEKSIADILDGVERGGSGPVVSPEMTDAIQKIADMEAEAEERLEDNTLSGEERARVQAQYDAANKWMEEHVRSQKGDGKVQKPTKEEKVMVRSLVDLINEMGIPAHLTVKEGQAVLDKYREMVRALRAYHGSGADFDAFDHSHMGEGEGAQAYGYGTYVTEVEGIGRKYAESLGKNLVRYIGKEYMPLYLQKTVERMLSSGRKLDDIKQSIAKTRDMYNDDYKNYPDHEKEERTRRYNEAVKYLENVTEKDFVEDGGHYIYTVDIPDDNGSNYIDWNKIISKGVRDVIKNGLEKEGYTAGKPEDDEVVDSTIEYKKDGERPILLWDDATFESFMHDNFHSYDAVKETSLISKILHDAGFTGIKYPAQYMTGGRSDNAKNYVIFDENDIKIVDKIRFHKAEDGSYEPEMKPVFYSNAMKAVEGIKQEKATPEQWLKMIEKAGGLKAGEDKWTGLSEWLKGLTLSPSPNGEGSVKPRILTKQEVMDYLMENAIEVEEVEYNNMQMPADYAYNLRTELNDKADDVCGDVTDDYADRIEEAEDFSDELDEIETEMIEEARRRLDYEFGIPTEHYISIQFDTDGKRLVYEPVGRDRDFSNNFAQHVWKMLTHKDGQPINETRLQYTTDFLDNKREIALVVPNIESWNEYDDVHFGDAGEGRAVAWVRFGDTTTIDAPEDIRKQAKDALKAVKDYQDEMREKYRGDYGVMPDDENAKYDQLVEEFRVAKERERNAGHPKRVLVIDEIQSKRHQEGREKGYASKNKKDNLSFAKSSSGNYWLITDNNNPNFFDRLIVEGNETADDAKNRYDVPGIPDAPFDKNWHEVAMKRMLRYAAENGYDKVAWTTGEQQAQRYDLSKELDILSIRRNADGTYNVEGRRKGDVSQQLERFESNVPEDKLANIVGKDVAKRAIEYKGIRFELKGEGLRIGGEGMNGFYDQILPRFVDKYTKKWGVKTTDINLPNIGDNGLTMHSVDVTPEMKADVMEGQPMFFKTPEGEVYGFTLGGEIYIDPRYAKPDTPVHEYTHLWAQALRDSNPTAWARLKEEMKGVDGGRLWNYVSSRYPELKNEDELVEEVFAHYSGKRGGERLEGDMREEMKKVNGIFEKAHVANIFHKLRRLLQRFWKMARDLFAGKVEGVEKLSAEDFADMALGDLMRGFDPRESNEAIKKRDKAYMDAVEKGDMDTAQRMVLEAAKAAMPKTKVVDENGMPLVLYHGTTKDFTVFDKKKIGKANYGRAGFFFTPDKSLATDFTRYRWQNPNSKIKNNSHVVKVFLNATNPLYISAREYTMNILDNKDLSQYDSVIITPFTKDEKTTWDRIFGGEKSGSKEFDYNQYCVFDPSQIKSADSVTYDDEGNVIPLSKRFNKRNADIRFHKGDSLAESIDLSEIEKIEAQPEADGFVSGVGVELTMTDGNSYHLWVQTDTDDGQRGITEFYENNDEGVPGEEMTKRFGRFFGHDVNEIFGSGIGSLLLSDRTHRHGITLDREDILHYYKQATSAVKKTGGTYRTKDGVQLSMMSLFEEGESGVDGSNGKDESTDLTNLRLRKLAPGEMCLVERRYEENKQFSFTGSEKIESMDDVAYIFKQLEDAAVENVFLALVKDGKPTVIHIGMGTYAQSAFDFRLAFAAYKDIQPDAVYVVHNHPSGALKASKQDRNMLYNAKMYFGADVVKDGIIIDTVSGKYGVFGFDGERENAMPESADNEVSVKTYEFSKQVFSEDWNPEEATKFADSSDIAAFISSQRLGEHPKMSFIVVNNQYQVVGNYFLPWTSISEIDDFKAAADELSNYVQLSGGTRGILYGNYQYDNADKRNLQKLAAGMKSVGTPLTDVLHIDIHDELGYHSANNSEELTPEKEYEAPKREAGEDYLSYAKRIVEDRNAYEAIVKAYEAFNSGVAEPVTEEEMIRRLEAEPKIKVYRAMQLIDGQLYPPMSAKVDGQLRQPSRIGEWEQSEEMPDMVDENGKFKLDKGNKKSLKAAYNPYIHGATTMLNDQFSEAQDRPNLVVVEMEVPVSELTSGYRAEKAKDSVGMMPWKAGVIQGKLTGKRDVMLSRWAKPVRIVPVEEVAKNIASQIAGQIEVMPSNVVTPQVRAEMEKLGVKFVETDNTGKIKEGENAGKTWSSVYGKNIDKVEEREEAAMTEHVVRSYRAYKEMNSGVSEVNDPGVEEILNDGRMGMREKITATAIKMANEQRDNMELRNAAVRAIGGNLMDIRKAMSLQREYDKGTVKRVADLARVLVKGGYLEGATNGEMSRILSIVKNATGKSDITGDIRKLMEIMVDSQLRRAEKMLSDVESIKGSKVDSKGVEVQGKLDVAGQQVMKTFKETRDDKEEDLSQDIAEAENRMLSDDAAVAEEATNVRAGLLLSLYYQQNIRSSKTEERKLREELDDARHATDRSLEFENTILESIQQNRVERLEAYNELMGMLGETLQKSVDAAKEFTEADKERVREIQHNANSDMAGRPAKEHYKPKWKDKMANNDFVQFFFKPLATFDQMLRLFGSKSANGEGYLYNRFMRGWVDAREKEIRGVRGKYAVLDEKVKSLFGNEAKNMAGLIRLIDKMPKATVLFKNGGELIEHQLTQGNLMYIYMVNKMLDGRMKLRKMGVDEKAINEVMRILDPRLMELADWMQEDFLVDSRNEYNETHKRIFGAPMAAIEHYFPLKINPNARVDKAEDLDDFYKNEGISTKTGSIIKRRRNALALDILNADALNVILDHVAKMEHWNAFAEFNRDLNTLRTYAHFRNQVKNMTTIYGSGDKLWEKFNDLCQMAAGTYRPKRADLDVAATNLAKGVTAAKVSARIFTALKQFLSMPAYLPDARPDLWAKNLATPWKSWSWAMENLPIFEERWKSRMAGDPRLLKSELDWKGWRNNIVQMASKIGMSPNAFVDALTVSIGAKTIYESRKARYLKEGYSEEQAERKAKQDAEIAYNQTQQSSEGAFLSTMQVDRSWLSVMLTVFRNSSMAYQRQLHDALRNLKRDLKKGNREQSIEFMAKQMVREGVDEEQAKEAATARYDRQVGKDALRVATFGVILQFCWNLGAYLPYLLFGDDDDKKSDMWDDIFAKSMFGWGEGLTGGDVFSEAGKMIATGKGNPEYLKKEMPAMSDVVDILKEFGTKKSHEAITDIINLVVQAGIGFNPQTATDVVLAIMDRCGNDPKLAKESLIMWMRILQVPQSQLRELYLDEIDMTGEEASKLTPEQLAERYARYQVKRGRFFQPWEWNNKDDINREKKNATKKIKERVDAIGGSKVNKAYEQYEEQYKDYYAKVKEYTSSSEYKDATPLEKAQWLTELYKEDPQGYAVYSSFKNMDAMLDKMVKYYLASSIPQEAQACHKYIEEYKQAMVDVLGAESDEERAAARKKRNDCVERFYNEVGNMQKTRTKEEKMWKEYQKQMQKTAKDEYSADSMLR